MVRGRAFGSVVKVPGTRPGRRSLPVSTDAMYGESVVNPVGRGFYGQFVPNPWRTIRPGPPNPWADLPGMTISVDIGPRIHDRETTLPSLGIGPVMTGHDWSWWIVSITNYHH